MNVLITDDNADDRKLLQYALEHHGCTVIEAKDGQEGFELAGHHKPDLIVSDALMPRMDGFQFLRALKSEPELATIPFIFYSAIFTGEPEKRLALSLGAAAFVVKPTEPEELWSRIHSIMEAAAPVQDTNQTPQRDETGERFITEYSRIITAKLEEKIQELELSLELRTRAEEDLRTLNAKLNNEIAERKRAEHALRTQERELSTIFENAPFMMLLLDENRKIRRVNGMACSFTNSSASDMVNQRGGEALRCIHALNAPEGCGSEFHCRECTVRQTVLNTFETGLSHQQVEASLALMVAGKERTIPFLISTAKVMVGSHPMVLLSIQEISEYKKLEEQLLHAQKMESIGTLAGGIAHDFNNILTAIFGYGDIALMNMAADGPQRRDVENMLQAAHRAATLAKDLLLFSRKQVSNRKSVDLNDIVRSAEKLLRRVISEDISCSITLDSSELAVLADEHRLEQVLINLGTNARDAMPDGGSITISTERTRLDDAFIAAHGYGSTGMYAILTVADTGTGMDHETRQQIFDPFFTTKEAGKGTGLGLAVVYGIIKQHDGQITVDSKPDHGTTFRIYLPLSEPAIQKREMDPENVKPERGIETILLAEDDETVRNMALSLLESFGYDVIAAVDGADAVQKFRENSERVRLLLFDVIMPNKNGLVAYDEIKTLVPDIRVIFASGYATEAVHQKAQDDANIMSISKPYLPSNLLAMVRSMLDK